MQGCMHACMLHIEACFMLLQTAKLLPPRWENVDSKVME